GITLSAVLGAAALVPRGSKAAVPTLLANGTVRAALSFAAGKAMEAGTASAKVVGLAHRVMRTIVLTKVLTPFLIATAVLAATAGLVAHRLTAEEPVLAVQRDTNQAAGSDTDLAKPEKEQPARIDRYGDPLPPGALLRLGTIHLRHQGE